MNEFISDLSILLVYVSFLCQYHTVLITIVLEYIDRLKSGSVMLPALFFLKIALTHWSLLWLHMNFRILFIFFYLTKCHWNFERDFIEYVEYVGLPLGSMDILTILSLPFQEHEISFHLFVSSVFFISILLCLV